MNPDQPGYKYARLEKEPTKQDVIDSLNKTKEEIKPAPLGEGKLPEDWNHAKKAIRNDDGTLNRMEAFNPCVKKRKPLNERLDKISKKLGAWRDYVEPLQSRVSELQRENERLELLIKDNEKWIRIYKSSGEDVAKQMELLQKDVETLRDDLTKKQLVYEFAVWLHAQNFTNPDISIHEWVDRFFKQR